MSNKKDVRKKQKQVYFDEDVLVMLDEFAKNESYSRSSANNFIVKKFLLRRKSEQAHS